MVRVSPGCRTTKAVSDGEQVKSRQREAQPAVETVDLAGRIADVATADVRELLRVERRRRRFRVLAVVLVVVAVGAVVTLVLTSTMFDPVKGEPSRGGTPPGEKVAMLDLADPFASTPAAHWADGVNGIVVPPPAAVAGFTPEEVAEATRLVREALVASRLDPNMLVAHDPATYLSLLAPDARRLLEPLFGTGREPEVQSLVSLVADGAKLLPVDAKVSGSMTVRQGDADELVVHTNYVFAYAFEPAEPTRLVDAMDTIVVVRADVDYVLRTGERWTPNSRGLWYGDTTGFSYSISCEAYQKGFLAPAATERSVTDGPAGERPEYFDPTAPLPPSGGCRP